MGFDANGVVSIAWGDWPSGHEPRIEAGLPFGVFPEEPGQRMHIFEDRPGHVVDTPENRKMILDTANNPNNYLGIDKWGAHWYQKTFPSGKQVWVQIWKNRVSDAGVNEQAIDLIQRYKLKK